MLVAAKLLFLPAFPRRFRFRHARFEAFFVYLNFTNYMAKLKHTSLDEFYQQAVRFTGKDLNSLLPPDIHKEIGHFNVFNIAETLEEAKRKSVMPYNRRAYYKISLIRGRNRAEYADKVINIKKNALLFATPKVPYHWIPRTRTSRAISVYSLMSSW